MGVTAHVPIRVRIDPAIAGADIDAAVRDAIRQAAGRGLAALEREVLGPRGGYARPHFQPAEFRWNGRPVDAGWRQGLEIAIGEELAGLATGISARVEQQLAAAPEVAPPNPSEWFDPQRQGSGGYLVASYEGELPSPDVPLYFSSHDAAMAWLPAETHYDWWEGRTDNMTQVGAAVRAVIPQRFGSAIPTRFGIMFWATDINAFAVMFFSTTPNAAGDDRRIQLDSWLGVGDSAVRFRVEGASTLRGTGLGVHPTSDFGLDRLGDFASNDELEALIRARMLAKYHLAVPAPAGEAAADATRRAGLLTYAHNAASSITLTSGHYYRLLGSGQDIGIPSSITIANPAGVVIVPVASARLGAFTPSDEESFASRSGRSGAEGGAGGAGANGAAGSGGEGGAGAAGGGNPDALEGGEGGGTAGPIPYPVIVGGETLELDLGPFEGEPNLNALGELGDAMRRLIARIAFRLGMPTGDYCGAFLIAAAQVIGGRAAAIAISAEQLPQMTAPRPAGNGNLGALDMQPEITPAIQLMRHLGGTCPLISDLTRLMSDTYRIPSIMAMFTGHRRSEWAGWMLDFMKEHTPTMTESVATMYQRTCQIMMLQLLRASHAEITNRITHFDEYFPMAEALINRLLRSEAELLILRDSLISVQAFTSPGAKLQEAVSTWREARQLLSDDLSDMALTAAAITSPGRLLESRGSLEHYDDGWKVRDTRGRLWTMEELEREIAMRHQTAASLDPLINQFNDIPAVAATFRDSPQLARVYLLALLTEMKTNNEEITTRTKNDNLFAFQSGRIMEDLPNATVSGTEVPLQGIHLLAHQAIGASFQSNHWYGVGLDWAFDVELGKQSLTLFAETVSVIALSVLCPPLGIALGAGIAVAHYHHASVREQLYESLIDPEQLMSRAEVEFDLFMAQFEVALSIIPDIGAIGRGVGSVSRAGARGMARAGVAGAGRAAMRRVQRELMAAFAQQVRAGLARAFVTTVLVDRVMALTLPHILGPVMEDVNREITILTGGSVPPRAGSPAPVATASSAAGLPPPDYEAMSPAESELVRRLEEYQEGDRDERITPASEAP